MVDSARHTRWRVPLRIIALLVIVGAMLMGVSPASAATKKLTATPKPTITGSTVVGKKLTAKPGTWKPSSVTLTYQWLRNGSSRRPPTCSADHPNRRGLPFWHTFSVESDAMLHPDSCLHSASIGK